MNKFWNWMDEKDAGRNVLRLEGAIAEESWFEDEVTPKLFREELAAVQGDIVVWINSPGGDCNAASQIYTMLMGHQGSVTVKIDGIAASAASVIAMAGTKVLMAPTAMMMIHDPLACAYGNAEDFEKIIEELEEYKEAIINAYELKTGMSRAKIARLMNEETYMNARKAMEYGFCDGLLENERGPSKEAYAFHAKASEKTLCAKMAAKYKTPKNGISADPLYKRLQLLKSQI